MIQHTFPRLVILFLLVYVFGCAAAHRESAKEIDENSEIRIYEVFGMDCPACASGLEKIVKKITGVIESEANWKDKQLVIKVDNREQLQDDDINDAIKRGSFTPGKRIK